MTRENSAQMLMIKKEMHIEDYIGDLQKNMRIYDELKKRVLDLEAAKTKATNVIPESIEELEEAAANADHNVAMAALTGLIVDRKIADLKGYSTYDSDVESRARIDALSAKMLRGDKISVSAVSPSRHAIETMPYPTHGFVCREGKISEVGLDLTTGGFVRFRGKFREYEASPLVDRDIDYASPFEIRTTKPKR